MTRWRWALLAAAIAVLALAASANSVANGFAYDDVVLIARSARMHSLHGWWREFASTYWPGGDGYRPLTILAWRMEWVLGGGAPAVFHAVNVLLHAAAAVAVFWMAGALLPTAGAWTAAALYAVHPVHTEAIANVVGQSELAVALLLVIATGLYLRGRTRGALSPARWTAIGALYAAACLFKEHAVVLPLLLLVAETTVVRDAPPMRERLSAARMPLLVLSLVAACYLWLRSTVVIGGLGGFQPFIVFQSLHLSASDRVLTMIGASTEWLRLLLWPARLMTQYSPPYLDVAQGPHIAQLPGLLVLVGTVGLMIACWRRSPVVAFGLAWLVITLLPASNFILPAGFIIAERTLLLPSVGAMIALAAAFVLLARRVDPAYKPRVFIACSAAALGAVLALGIARSITRNRVWHDDDTLWRQSVRDSPDSYLAHFKLAVHLFSHGDVAGGEAEYRRSIDLFPYDAVVAYAFAEQLRSVGRCDAALPLYAWLFEASPNARRGHLGRANCLLAAGQYAEAREEALLWLRRGGRVSFGRAILEASAAARDSARAKGSNP